MPPKGSKGPNGTPAKAPEAERPDTFESESDYDSDASVDPCLWHDIVDLETDADYIAWVRDVWQPLLQADFGLLVPQERAYLQWRAQDGMCALTGAVLVGVAGGKGLYAPALVPVSPNRPWGDPGNCRVVASYVHAMYAALDRYHLGFAQFARLLAAVDGEAE